MTPTMFRLGTLLLAGALAAPPVSIKVNPQAYMPGNTIVVTCRVPPHPDNRRLEAVLDNYTTSTRQLDGENAPVTSRFEFRKVPCDVPRAACVLTDVYGRQHAAIANLEAGGCEP